MVGLTYQYDPKFPAKDHHLLQSRQMKAARIKIKIKYLVFRDEPRDGLSLNYCTYFKLETLRQLLRPHSTDGPPLEEICVGDN